MENCIRSDTRQVIITGEESINLVLSSCMSKLGYIKAHLEDDGTGFMVTPEGWNQNDATLLQSIIETLRKK